MTVIVHYNGKYQDSLTFEADSIEEAREIAYDECYRRDWDHSDCWSEVKD